MKDSSSELILKLDEFSPLTKRQDLRCKLTFILIGASCMYYWNSVLNTLYSIRIWNGGPDSITAVYTSVAFVTCVVLTLIGGCRVSFHYTGGIVLVLMSLLYPVAAVHLVGTWSTVLMHIGAALAGIAEMLFQVSGFGFALLLNRKYSSYLSFGYGVCGIVTFAVWMLFSQGIFKISAEDASYTGMQKAVWCHFTIGAVVIATSLALIGNILKWPETQALLDQVDNKFNKQAKVSDSGMPGNLTLVQIFKETWPIQLGIALLMGMSMMAYPTIGPYMWNLSIQRNDILTGVFQIFDFFGRYLAVLGNHWSALMLPTIAIFPLTIARLVFIVLFAIMARNAAYGMQTSVLDSFGVEVTLMVTLALTHGWYAGVYMTRVGDRLKTPHDKARASSMAVGFLVIFIAIGLWLAKLVRFNVPSQNVDY